MPKKCVVDSCKKTAWDERRPFMKTNALTHMKTKLNELEGRVLPPLLLYMFGVPGFLCILLWLFFFRGR